MIVEHSRHRMLQLPAVRRRLAFLAASVATVFGTVVALAEDTPLPRYRFEVGQQLTYVGQSKFEHERGSYGDHERWVVYVVEKAGGRWRLVIRHEDLAETAVGQEQQVSAATHFAHAELSELGELVELDGSFAFHHTPRKLFPKLPETAEEFVAGWSTPAQFDGTLRCRVVGDPGAAPCIIEVREERPENAIYGFELRDTFTFDDSRGFIERSASTSKQTWSLNGQGTGKVALEGISNHDALWAERFAREAKAFFKAQKEFQQATASASATRQSLDAAVTELQAATAGLIQPELRAQASLLARRFAKERSTIEEELATRASLLGAPAESFSTVDVDGKPHSLADYRGRVVLLDFWYRGCGWCIRCMPQLSAVDAHYRGRPVALLGINSDEDLDDAQLVIDRIGITYPTLRAGDLAKPFKVSAYPTLVVIDQHGVIRGLHVGYSPHLRERLIAEIDALLSPKGTPSAQ